MSVSLIYTGVLMTGIFPPIQNPDLRDPVFCTVELLLLCPYWYFTYRYARHCRHHSYSRAEYLLAMGIVFVLFSAICLAAYFLLPRSLFVTLFRITVNLAGLRFLTALPEALLPYLAAYLGVSLLVLLLEPFVSRLLRRRLHRRRSGRKRFRLSL